MNDLFAAMYELAGLLYLGSFFDSLFDNNLYSPVGIIMVVSSLAMMLIYYYAIDHPKFAKWYHWLIWTLVAAMLNFAVAYLMTDYHLEKVFALQEQPVPYSSEFFTFSSINAIFTLLFCTLFSFLIRGKSVMCRRTPF